MSLNPSNFATALRLQLKNHGWRTGFIAVHRLWTYGYRRSFAPKNFHFRGKDLPYLYHPYILYVERAVEIPIVMDCLAGRENSEILEVGNVLSHYYSFPHDVVDKYEQAPGVMNVDVVDYAPKKRYDLIVSISTLEHVGYDEQPQQKDKFLLAVQNLKSLLKSKGQLVVTLPMGYNPWLDEFIRTGQTGFAEMYYLKRITESNLWQQVQLADVRDLRFGTPFLCANGLAVGYFQKA